MVTVPVIVLWLAVVPIQKGIVAFPPPAIAFHTKAACEVWIKNIPHTKTDDYSCVQIVLINDEKLMNNVRD